MLTRCLAVSLPVAQAGAQPIVIKTTALFDGQGHMLRNRQIAI
jgi:hypothetical protein